MDVFELTRRLISIPSISGDEKAVALFLADYLESQGFEIELQNVEGDRPNVYARHGDPSVVLSTHTDTVPPFLELREDDQFIYGRGACDAKGIIAAMVKAAQLLIEANVSDFGLLFVVASYGDHARRFRPEGRSRHLIYPLSLAIYCTSWTFFGSVGLATRTGFEFLTIYVGPIIMVGLCYPLIMRVVRLAKTHCRARPRCEGCPLRGDLRGRPPAQVRLTR